MNKRKGILNLPKDNTCPFCKAGLSPSLASWILHLSTIHKEYLPSVEENGSFNPSAKHGKIIRELTEKEYLELIKLLRKLEKY